MRLAKCRECHWTGTPDEAWQHEVFHWVEESCRASGVPFHVSDPHAIKQIVALLGYPQKGTRSTL